MFKSAFLQEVGNGRLQPEEQLLKSEFERRGIPVLLYTMKRIRRRDLPLSTESFVAGNLGAMHGAMKQLGIAIPPPNDYPRSLTAFLHRRIWKSTLAAVEDDVNSGRRRAVFAKPATRRKNFTGRVFASSADFACIGIASRRQEVWCSEVVEWRAEYRVYVMGIEPIAVGNYDGDPTVRLDMEAVGAVLRAYRASREAPSAYGIDFGVLGTGETALVEANDGYALGAYTIAAAPYTDLLIERWKELVSTARPAG